MTKRRNQHVVPRDGGWAVKPEGGQRASGSTEPSARRLTAAARFPATRSELFVHGRDSRIRERDSHGHDPRCRHAQT